MMPLTLVEMGKKVTILRVTGRDETKRFLESLGFIVGAEISIISKFGQNFIISVKDTRVALDETMAKRIFV